MPEPLRRPRTEEQIERGDRAPAGRELADLDPEVEREAATVSRWSPANCSDSRSANEKPKPCTIPKAKATIQRATCRELPSPPTMFSSAM